MRSDTHHIPSVQVPNRVVNCCQFNHAGEPLVKVHIPDKRDAAASPANLTSNALTTVVASLDGEMSEPHKVFIPIGFATKFGKTIIWLNQVATQLRYLAFFGNFVAKPVGRSGRWSSLGPDPPPPGAAWG